MSLEKQRHHYVSQFWMLRFRDAIPFMKSDAQFTSEAAKLGIGAGSMPFPVEIDSTTNSVIGGATPRS